MFRSDLIVRLFAALPLAILGCGESTSSDSNDSMGGMEIRGLGGSRSLETGGITTQEPPRGGTGGIPDAMMTAGQPTTGGTAPDEPCLRICSKYEACERSDEAPGANVESCLESCRAINNLSDFDEYLMCVESAMCNALQNCRTPSAPVMVQCAEVCEALASESCNGDRRLPKGFPEVDSCLDGCAFVARERQILQCGEAYVLNPDSCDEATFAWCLVQARSPSCARQCEKRSQCEEGVDRVDCAIECIQKEYDVGQGNVMPDPVAARRDRERLNCVLNAANCEDHDACLQNPGRQLSDDNINALCAADADCNFLPSGDACVPTAERLLRATADMTGVCLQEQFQNACGESPLTCIQPYIPEESVCAEYCQVASQCRQLPAGLTRNECQTACESAVQRQDIRQLGPFRQGLACAFSNSCESFSQCLAQGGDATCDELCERRIDCGVVGADECAAECDSRKSTLRNWSERTCTQAAGVCDGVNLCVAPSPPDCARYCMQLGERCGAAPEDCVTRCDDSHFVNPDVFLPRYACLAATEDCDERARCDQDVDNDGLACLNWCRSQETCAGDSAGILDCIDACTDGLNGRESLVFEGARDCLTNAGVNGSCDDLAACVDGSDPGFFCAEYCNELGPDGCKIITDIPACVAQCGQLFGHDLMGGAPAGGLAQGGGMPAAGGLIPGGAPVGGELLGGMLAIGGSLTMDENGGVPLGGESAGGERVGGVAEGGMMHNGGALAGGELAGGVTVGGSPIAGLPFGPVGGIVSGGIDVAGAPAGGRENGGNPAGEDLGDIQAGGQTAPAGVRHSPSIESVACVIAAIRNGGGCATIAHCIGAEEAGPLGCGEGASICLPEPSDMCRDYCTAQAQCNAEFDLFQCRRACTPDPEYLPVRTTCAGLVAGCVGAQNCARWPRCLDNGVIPEACAGTNDCERQNLCQTLDGAIPAECTAACGTIDACGGDLIGNEPNSIASTIEQCQIDCAAQSALGLDGRQAFLDGLGQCLSDAACEPGAVKRCMRGVPPVDCAGAAMAMQECLDNGGDFAGLLGIPAGGVAGYVMSCEQLSRNNPMAAEQQVMCILNAQQNGGGGLPVPIPLPGLDGLLACAPYVMCFEGLVPVP